MTDNAKPANRFDVFFVNNIYLRYKNALYNYNIRRQKINRFLDPAGEERILEIGSGISPMLAPSANIVYTDLSCEGLARFRALQEKGAYCTADATALPFSDGSFSAVVCSEVLEHVPDDTKAIREIVRVLKPGGRVILTVPTQPRFFAADDRFVKHFRRYDAGAFTAKLTEAGFMNVRTVKVAGLLDKFAMVLATQTFKAFFERGEGGAQAGGPPQNAKLLEYFFPLFSLLNRIYAFFVRAEARIIPRSLATITLFFGLKP